ncbi:RNA/RNP complex-1-interacting phosphatase-like isoform X7 [Canis lupus baileyi]|uniref:RNA/RNP complex-1-interacting phosphatase-like isoform X11 n=1 Tax=Canis lupus familiaris TaxID=9615 RepID=UPI000BAA10C1|nr:RNA/RNP complex-1-interacting phosphatase-like isoform X11 [Canis lupus familiaris]XP_038296047.1 RNA/RNP complex-1-interacting phosphatase-like isoform X11 [Canis lupus familiaris]XP_038434293.1 RNA/RNP complex-1-interacting phosphatase-like isoform X11 [Canis lupus familiaris]|eukprot:XP_022267738.1 RNA/RNP complex-1-interacting phosphatase-like isoform X11 [Canis lupus familiaris]
MVKKNSIPDGWRTVTPIGHPVPGTRFIAFKVPLKGAVNQRLTPTQKFTPKDLISAIKALNVELGLIIDLTYTTRYYEVKDLPKSIHYKKLYTVGLEVPDNATILQFKKWVRKFLWENAENGKLIGVHCTNGINRTGYLICRYLIDVEGWDPDTAIQVILEWMSGILMKMQISHLILWKTLKIGPQMKTFMGLGKGQDILMTSTLEMIHRDHGTDNCRSKSQRCLGGSAVEHLPSAQGVILRDPGSSPKLGSLCGACFSLQGSLRWSLLYPSVCVSALLCVCVSLMNK